MLLVWLGLLLAPLFKEVSLFGFKYKHDFAEFKQEIKGELLALRTEVQQSVSVHNSFSPNIALGALAAPAPDATLQALKQHLPRAIAEALRVAGALAPADAVTSPPPDEQYLYGVRVELEREMRRIVQQRQLSPLGPRVVRPTDLPSILMRAEFISPDIGNAIREVYLICSRALHAEDVTPTQIAFVKDAAPHLLGVLRATS